MSSPRIAVVGSGISGLSAAWLLSRSAEVTLFEKADRIGGHSNTVSAALPGGAVPVDTGFIVYNQRNYPNLTALFDHLGVGTSQSTMSFAVSVDNGRMEYSGQHLAGLFGQRRNIVRIAHWQLVADILRFFREAEKQAADIDDTLSMSAFLDRFNYSRVFVEDHILPMSAAIWSTPARSMLEFPAKTFIEFFSNHGLLQVGDRPKWRTVTGGSQSYIDRLLADSRFKVETGANIQTIVRHIAGVEIFLGNGRREHFDQVILACHADQSLALLADPSPEENAVLGAFRYTRNHAVLHTDAAMMPRRQHLWSAWNYLRGAGGAEAQLSLTYWMNALQPLETTTNVFVSLNPGNSIAPQKVLREFDYEHPVFDAAAIAAQHSIWTIQGRQRTWYAGAWLGYGFHEDGLQSGLEVAERIGPVNRPWAAPAHRDRIAHNWAGEDTVRWAAE